MYEYVFMFLLLDSYLYSHKNAKMICRCVFLKGLLQLLQWKFHFFVCFLFSFSSLCERSNLSESWETHTYWWMCFSIWRKLPFLSSCQEKILQFFFMHISNKCTTWSYFRAPTFYTPETYTHWSFMHHQQNKHPRICLYPKGEHNLVAFGNRGWKTMGFPFFFILNTLWMFSDIHMWVFFPKT